MAPRHQEAPTGRDHARWRTAAWVLYDLANTVYAATLTFLFTPFARRELGGLSGVGAANFASMTLAALLVPLCGALADRTARTSRYLGTTTLLCIAAIAGFGLDLGPGWLLGCFFVANLTYNLALLFYNALLPSVATVERAGRVSGLGVGLGYFGTIVVLAVLVPLPVDQRLRFPIAAAMFLAGALPCLLLVPDQRRPQAGGEGLGAATRAAAGRLRATLRELPRHRPLLWFLCGNLCLVDVLNTAILYFADFTAEVFRGAAAAGELQLLGWRFGAGGDLSSFQIAMGIALNVLALGFGIALGGASDRAPLAVMRASAGALLGALAGGVLFGGTSALGYLATLVALGAFGLAGIWTAGRKVVVLLAPSARIGEFFGLYGITVKLSVFGSVLYGVVADAAGSKPAMLAQSGQLLLGLGFLCMVRLPAPHPAR